MALELLFYISNSHRIWCDSIIQFLFVIFDRMCANWVRERLYIGTYYHNLLMIHCISNDFFASDRFDQAFEFAFCIKAIEFIQLFFQYCFSFHLFVRYTLPLLIVWVSLTNIAARNMNYGQGIAVVCHFRYKRKRMTTWFVGVINWNADRKSATTGEIIYRKFLFPFRIIWNWWT